MECSIPFSLNALFIGVAFITIFVLVIKTGVQIFKCVGENLLNLWNISRKLVLNYANVTTLVSNSILMHSTTSMKLVFWHFS